MSASNWHHVGVEKILKITDKAFCVRLDGGEEMWIPISQISDSDDYEEGDEDLELSVTEWIAKQKGLL